MPAGHCHDGAGVQGFGCRHTAHLRRVDGDPLKRHDPRIGGVLGPPCSVRRRHVSIGRRGAKAVLWTASVIAGDLSRPLLDSWAAVGVVGRAGVAGLVEAADLVVGEVDAGGAKVVVELLLGAGAEDD